MINSGSTVNVISLVYATKQGLTTQKTRVGAQKIDGLPLQIYGMVLVIFSLEDSLEKVRFFKESFLLTNTNIEVVLEMLFLVFSNADFWFYLEKLI